MQFRQHALIRQALIVAALLLNAADQVVAASDMLEVCQGHETSSSLPRDTVKVLSLNISHGRNRSLNQLLVSKKRTYENLDKIATLLEKVAPDVVAFQEADAASRWSGNFDHVAYVAEQSGFPCIVHGYHSKSWISTYGTALLSRSKAAESASVQFSPSWPSKQKGFVSVTFAWSAGQRHIPITLVSVHFDFLRSGVRDQQVQEMVSHLSKIDGPLVLMGDLNSQWDGNTSHVRMLTDELNLRAFSPENSGLGTYKKPTGKRLDWILISHHLQFQSYRVLPDVVADHFAIFAELIYQEQQE
jgi:endonuclease/exonuclease/phosphatase family metal-dependent hydrolase